MQSASVCLDGYHLGDIIVSPPTGWGNTRKLAYFDWAKSVIDGLLCAHPTKRTVIPRPSMEMSRQHQLFAFLRPRLCRVHIATLHFYPSPTTAAKERAPGKRLAPAIRSTFASASSH